MSPKIKAVQLRFFLLLLLLLVCGQPAQADLSGLFKYSYQTDYVDLTPARQVFTQEYLTNLKGAILDDRVGSYQLGLQYQKGATELKNFTFTNTLNFREALKVTTSYSKKDFGQLVFDPYNLSDNRFAVSAAYYQPFLPSLMVGYEGGDAQTASGDGLNRYDKKAEVGLSYTFWNNTISTRYVRSALYDNTYLSSASNIVNHDNLFTFSGAGSIGELINLNSTYSDQRIYNQTGATSLYNQKLQNLTASASLRLLPSLNLNSEFTSAVNATEYELPSRTTALQQSNLLGLAVNLRPLEEVELVLGGGVGTVNQQKLTSGKAALNLNFSKDFLVNVDVKQDDYAEGGANQGKVLFANSSVTYPLDDGIKLSYRRSVVGFDGDIADVTASSAQPAVSYRKQDINDWGLGVTLPNNFYFEGGISNARINAYEYRGINAGLKYADIFEIKRENKYGNEAAQIINSQTDSVKVTLPLGEGSLSQRTALINNKTAAAADLYGFSNYTEVNYPLGDAVVNFNANSERSDQNSGAYTRGTLSFVRNF